MTLNGYDISAYQGAIDISAVPADFVIIKATGGDGYVNPNWRNQLAAARNAGKLVGIYHFARDGYTNATAASEANWFIQNCADVLDGTVLAVLDWEADNQTDVNYAKNWLDIVTAQTGVKPVIYMSFATINAADWSSVAKANYGLWESAYVLGYQQINGYNPPAGLADIPYWSTRAMWQYTSVGRLPGWGDNLDLDIFYGDANTWAAYAAKNGTITPLAASITPTEDDVPLTQADADLVVNTLLNRSLDRQGAITGPTNIGVTVAWLDSNLKAIQDLVKAVPESVLNAEVPWHGFDGNVPTSGRTTTTLATDIGWGDARAAGYGNLLASKIAALTPGQAIDPAAIANAVKDAIPADLAHQVVIELGKLFPSAAPPAAA